MSGTSVAIGCEFWVRHDGKHLYFWNCTNSIWQDCTLDETAPIPDYP